MARKITDEDLANRGVMGLPDVPGLTAIEMQKKLEEIPREVIIPRYNELVDSVADICEEFSKLITYDVGDYCIYENVLYKCTTAITTEGEWDATKWKATSIDKELKEISSYTKNKDVISDKYDSSKTYSVGDYCIYDDTLYKCKTEITSAEEFDSSKWEPTNCGKEFEVLNSNLTVRYNAETDYMQLLLNGQWTNWKKLGLLNYVLYDNGTLNVNFTQSGSGSVSYASDHITLTYAGTGSASSLTSDPIDKGEYTKLHILCKVVSIVDSTNAVTLEANTSATSHSYSNLAVDNDYVDRVLNIAGLSGAITVGLNMYDVSTLHISKIWLE